MEFALIWSGDQDLHLEVRAIALWPDLTAALLLCLLISTIPRIAVRARDASAHLCLSRSQPTGHEATALALEVAQRGLAIVAGVVPMHHDARLGAWLRPEHLCGTHSYGVLPLVIAVATRAIHQHWRIALGTILTKQ